MALQWHNNLKNRMIQSIFRPPPYFNNSAWPDSIATTTSLTIYGGTQPSAVDFATNWNSTYKAAQLIHFVDCTFSQPGGSTYLSVTGFPAPTAASNSGTATWAVVWGGGGTAGSGSVTLSVVNTSVTVPPPSPDAGVFMIVPVTNTGGNGIVRLDTTSIVASTNYSLGSFGLQIMTLN